jgi:penicillin-insensitive murein endopeptidase
MVRPLITLALIAVCALPASAQQKANQLFGAMRAGSQQEPSSIGSYAKGCAAGLVQMPDSGPTWQTMRLSRNRNWGQPVTLAFLQDLSREAARQGWAGLYIGDMSQPRGGPMTSGHTSHQTGLDADIWMLPPRRVTLSRAERENISSISVRTADQRSINENWTQAHYNIIKAAASDDRVDRIFVAAAIKIEMCRTATRRDRNWLQKVRPLYGHNDHFHVRLRCPEGDRNCVTQTPTVRELSNGGNGCDDTLMWWVTDYLAPPDPNAPKVPAPPPSRGARDYTMDDLPRQCRAVLDSR